VKAAIIPIIFSLIFATPNLAYASSSANFKMNQERGGYIEHDANSANFKIKAEIGHPGIGESTSANYIFDHGTWWMSGSSVKATIQWAMPEFRVGPNETNDDTTFFLRIMTADDTDNVVLFESTLAATNNAGIYATPIDLTGINAGTYDVGIKGHQHITRKLNDITLNNGTNTLNFTQADNSAPKGNIELIAGDVNNDGLTPATLGDDTINSVDITTLLSNFNDNDPTGNNERTNINQDTIVNSVDLSIILANFNKIGDH